MSAPDGDMRERDQEIDAIHHELVSDLELEARRGVWPAAVKPEDTDVDRARRRMELQRNWKEGDP